MTGSIFVLEHLRNIGRCIAIALLLAVHPSTPLAAPSKELAELGRDLFNEPALSRDGKTRCQSCHIPSYAYASPEARAVGVDGRRGTRNAPSLAGVADRTLYFWDGRRTRLDAVVLDPLTHPAEMGWSDVSDLSHKLEGRPSILRRFKHAFPHTEPVATSDQISQALAAFLNTLKTGRSKFDQAQAHQVPLSPEADFGRQLFVGIAQCSQCHTLDKTNSKFTDDQFHHSSIGNISQSKDLPSLVKDVTDANTQESQLGHKILLDSKWSSLGRFVVSLRPADIGAFRTPSLRNVAVTAPYMHDGSIATLGEAVDHEIYYRGFSSGRPINLSALERRALVAFLETLTDEEYVGSTARMKHSQAKTPLPLHGSHEVGTRIAAPGS